MTSVSVSVIVPACTEERTNLSVLEAIRPSMSTARDRRSPARARRFRRKAGNGLFYVLNDMTFTDVYSGCLACCSGTASPIPRMRPTGARPTANRKGECTR